MTLEWQTTTVSRSYIQPITLIRRARSLTGTEEAVLDGNHNALTDGITVQSTGNVQITLY